MVLLNVVQEMQADIKRIYNKRRTGILRRNGDLRKSAVGITEKNAGKQ